MPIAPGTPGTPSLPARPTPDTRPDRYFHPFAAAVLVALMISGFHHFFFAGRAYPGRELTPPIRNLIIIHGSIMAAWMLVFLVQPLLILGNNRRLHRRVGTAGAVIAGCAFLLGLKLGVESARVKPPGMLVDGLNATQFMAIPVLSMLAFGVCVAAGIYWRRNPSLHRSFMLVGTLFAISAAVARIDFLSDLYAGTIFATIWGPFFMTVVVALVLLALKSILTRKIDPKLAFGCAGLAVFLAFDFQVSTSRAWDGVAHFLLRIMG